MASTRCSMRSRSSAATHRAGAVAPLRTMPADRQCGQPTGSLEAVVQREHGREGLRSRGHGQVHIEPFQADARTEMRLPDRC